MTLCITSVPLALALGGLTFVVGVYIRYSTRKELDRLARANELKQESEYKQSRG